MFGIRALASCLAALLTTVAAVSAQENQDSERLDRMRFESAFASMIPSNRRLKVEVGSGPEGPGVRVIVDLDIARDPHLLSPSGNSGDEYLMDVQLQRRTGTVFAVRCNGSGCLFSQSAEGGYRIPGRLFLIPGDGCVYSMTQISGTFDAESMRAARCFKNGKFE